MGANIGAVVLLVVMGLVIFAGIQYAVTDVFGGGLFGGNAMADARADALRAQANADAEAARKAADAQANAIRLQAETQAQIDRWYANQRINESMAFMNAVDDFGTFMKYLILFIVAVVLLYVLVSFTLYVNNNKVIPAKSPRKFARQSHSPQIVVMDGEYYEVVGEDQYGRYILQYTDQPYGYIEG